MKHLNYIIVVSLLWGACFAQAFKTSQEVVAKLRTFQAQSFKNIDAKAKFKLEDDIVDTLVDSVKLAVKEPQNSELRSEVIRVSVLFLRHDDTQYAGELLLPLYEKNKSEFKNLIRNLPAADSRMVLEAVENASREASQGNG